MGMVELSLSVLIVLLASVALLLLLVVLVVLRLRRAGRELTALNERLEQTAGAAEVLARQRVEKSRSVLLGQVAEHFAPLLPGFGYQPKDARFLGQPVDFIVFNGLNDEAMEQSQLGSAEQDGAGSRGKAGNPPEVELVFVEIKTGTSRLSVGERAIRAAIEAGRVRFEVLRMKPDGQLELEG